MLRSCRPRRQKRSCSSSARTRPRPRRRSRPNARRAKRGVTPSSISSSTTRLKTRRTASRTSSSSSTTTATPSTSSRATAARPAAASASSRRASRKMPNRKLKALANDSRVKRIHLDRPTEVFVGRTAVTVGARAVQELMGYNGAGVGVAIVDSGITALARRPDRGQRPGPARRALRRLRQRLHAALRRLGSRHARRRHRGRQRLRHQRHPQRDRAGREHHRVEGARRRRATARSA